MRTNPRLGKYLAPANDADPREGAEIVDLATRNVLPAVSQRKPRSEGLGLAAGVAVVALLGFVTFWSMDNSRTADRQPPASDLPATTPSTPAPQAASVAEVAPVVPPEAITPAPGAALAAPAQSAVLAAPPRTAPAASTASNPHSSPTVVFDASALPAPGASAAGVPAVAGTGSSNDDFAARIGGVGGAKATAAAMIDPKTTVTQGTLIPAVLETAINTDVPGYVRAMVSSDVRSFDGSRVLVPRSSRLIGEYKSGLQAGQKRAYVVWTRLIRPDGVSVNLASPAIGFSGTTGLQGRVNSHFFERFGSAILLSVIGGLSAIAGNATTIIGGGGQSAAAAALGQTGQIGPTVRVRQGEPIRVFTARDLDFSKVTVE